MNNMRTAILEAADFIEQHPDQFDFMEIRVPLVGDECGCALGWTGHFYVDKEHKHCFRRVREVGEAIALTEISFYYEMNEIQECLMREGVVQKKYGLDNWRTNCKMCAACMRVYADRHYPAEEA